MADPAYSGSLALTWTNKNLRLIAREDGAYEWVPPTDYRAREVRLLHDAGAFGETHVERAKDNLLVRGDSLHALTSLTRLPEFADELVGKVKLVYIDPPFNTGEVFSQYDDGLEHSVWLTMMRDRLIQLRQLLSPDGSIWVHLDDNEMAYCRVLMDEVFGREGFVATVVWQKSHTRENRTDISTTHEYMIVFAMDRALWKQTRNPLTSSDAQLARYSNPDDDPRGPWASLPAHAKAEAGRRASQFFDVTTPSGRVVQPPSGRCWLYTEDRWAEMVEDDRIWFGADGASAPRVKKFLTEVQEGLVPVTIWPHDEVGTTGHGKGELVALIPGVTPFSTPKPERLLQRVIHIATDPGDIVLDCFAGSGTTAAVAHKMGRRWVAVEWERDTVATFTAPRLEKVLRGEDPGGITGDVQWEGGGGFRVLDVAESMYEDDEGTIVLADWATKGDLAEAVCAQLGFSFAPDGIFAGSRGRRRLAVVDGHITTDLVEVILAALGHKEVAVVVGVGLDPAAAERLEKARPGSRARTVPRDIIRAYGNPSAWRLTETPAREPAAGDQIALGDEVGEVSTGVPE